ncbi:excinuclease ABC subunit UvrC [Fulvivirga lutimaris]|uniref:excinuclease ABC subunit UvrC n=1 Tax=Fulvivirga lutimaris TaxID=1819566 RepID=UPI0012BB9E3C|nr:excinuclease ABC subunit UvrC [Fulvivirga lutimaris]MTI38868.1 excinuclease ABC subunit C [Fulvivirga lutimaris]
MKFSGYNLNQKSVLPNSPGVYKFFNEDQNLIYVGKAKSLKKRVASYFNKSSNHNRKTHKLISEIKYFDFTIVNSEFDALLLENNIIKEEQPKYNILLKDDKTFPYICIVNERFPRIITTRKLNKSKGEFFGPYSSVVAMNNVLELIRKLYTIRTCKLNLAESKITNGDFKVCLEYHIGNCLGPCEGLQTEENYNQDINSARNILKGNLSVVKNHFTETMNVYAGDLQFEKAQLVKEKIDLLEKFQSKSTVVNPKLSNISVFSIVSDEKYAFINFLSIHNGAITTAQTYEIKRALDESDEQILETVAFNLLKEEVDTKKEIYSNIPFTIGDIVSSVPQIGDKNKLVKLSLRNALEFKKNKILSKPIHDKSILILEQLKKDLRLSELPKHIECFDNSNIQGTNPVASMVCFKNGKPAKKDYRHYNIKTVIGPDDFSSMKEVVGRRYKRLLEEDHSLPQLIVIDGGKGQLSSACEALKAIHLYGKIPIIGIAKKLEEIYYPEDQHPLHISKKSSSLMLLQRLRDEAHRFAITFHRNKRSKSSITNELTNIEGIGQKSYEQLISKFKSVKKLKAANKEALIDVIGVSKANKIWKYLKQKKEA